MSGREPAGGRPLRPVDEDWSTALAVVAHPDDIEYGIAAAVARWTGQGKRVVYCLATSGEAGIDGIPPEEAGPLREREERAAAAVVGVAEVDFLGHPDGVLEYGPALRRDIARRIRRHRPDVVVTDNLRDTWNGGKLNQADHVAVGRCVLAAVHDAGNRWLFRELLDEGLQPWRGVRRILVGNSPMAGHGVDVTAQFAAGVRSLLAHRGYLAGLGDPSGAGAQAFLESIGRRDGARLGCPYAVSFEALAP